MKKITYATMGGDALEDLHRELDAAIAGVKSTFGKSYPLVIGGREVRGPSEFDDRSPIDTRILLGTFQSASREQTRDAIAAARAAYPAWSARPWQERVAMLKHGISDLRPFYESDLRWLRHYGFNPLAPTMLHEGV